MLFFSSCNKLENKEFVVHEEPTNSSLFDYLPTSTTGAIYSHSSYSFSYSENHEQSEWVAYVLEKNDLTNLNFQRPFFEQDPLVKQLLQIGEIIKNSGYDKGHLCPAADRKKVLFRLQRNIFLLLILVLKNTILIQEYGIV